MRHHPRFDRRVEINRVAMAMQEPAELGDGRGCRRQRVLGCWPGRHASEQIDRVNHRFLFLGSRFEIEIVSRHWRIVAAGGIARQVSIPLFSVRAYETPKALPVWKRL